MGFAVFLGGIAGLGEILCFLQCDQVRKGKDKPFHSFDYDANDGHSFILLPLSGLLSGGKHLKEFMGDIAILGE